MHGRAIAHRDTCIAHIDIRKNSYLATADYENNMKRYISIPPHLWGMLLGDFFVWL